MSLALLGLTAIMVLTSISFLSNFVKEKLGSLRDPLQVWEVLLGVDVLPMRLRGWIFSTIVGYANPYARTINFRITELRKGKACGVMKVRHRDKAKKKKEDVGQSADHDTAPSIALSQVLDKHMLSFYV
jgi:hypothetical protein